MVIIACSELTEVSLATVCWSTVQGAVMWHNLCNVLCELSELELYLNIEITNLEIIQNYN